MRSYTESLKLNSIKLKWAKLNLPASKICRKQEEIIKIVMYFHTEAHSKFKNTGKYEQKT